MLSEVIHRGGLTTVGEQGFPQIHPLAELLMLHLEMRGDDTPYRYALVPNAMFLLRHHGEWMMTPEQQASVLEAFWSRGWHVHVHVNGDAGLNLVLDQIEAVKQRHPAGLAEIPIWGTVLGGRPHPID